jgi:hypothetical protein
LIVDLVKSRWAAVALRLLFPLLGIGRIAREDGLVSIARGWSVERWRSFLGAPPAELRRRFPSRIAIVLRPGGPHDSLAGYGAEDGARVDKAGSRP